MKDVLVFAPWQPVSVAPPEGVRSPARGPSPPPDCWVPLTGGKYWGLQFVVLCKFATITMQ
jgi:hypothetical protein